MYRQILQVARSWQAAVKMDTPTERAYIKEEARRLFRKNREVSVCYVIVAVYWEFLDLLYLHQSL